MNARFGRNLLRFERGRYLLFIALCERPIAAELEIVPITVPLLSMNRPLSHDRTISWLSVPRLAARGFITVGGRTERVEAAPAYHDHNWGQFFWGDDFSWEWGWIQPREVEHAWSAVYVRMADRARSTIRYQGLSIWCGRAPVRIFRDDEIHVTHGRCIDLQRPLKIPRVMAMLSPGTASDVPRSIEITARSQGDELRLRFEAADLAQVVIPSERDIEGVTVLNEVSGSAFMHGRVRAANLAVDGSGFFEFVRE